MNETYTEIVSWCSKNLNCDNWSYCWNTARDDVIIYDHIVKIKYIPVITRRHIDKEVITFSFRNKEDKILFELTWG